jgi:nicotinamide-nucleotide amidase
MITNIVDKLSTICIQHSKKIVTAESCTGGLVAKSITDRAGCSQWFEGGFVTYSNIAKEQMLAVDKQLLSDYGAVSEAVALAMAKGALRHSQAQFSLSITGIAGPEGGTIKKPVGLIWFAWAYYDNFEQEKIKLGVLAKNQQFFGDREAIREQATLFSLQQLLALMINQLPSS